MKSYGKNWDGWFVDGLCILFGVFWWEYWVSADFTFFIADLVGAVFFWGPGLGGTSVFGLPERWDMATWREDSSVCFKSFGRFLQVRSLNRPRTSWEFCWHAHFCQLDWCYQTVCVFGQGPGRPFHPIAHPQACSRRMKSLVWQSLVGCWKVFAHGLFQHVQLILCLSQKSPKHPKNQLNLLSLKALGSWKFNSFHQTDLKKWKIR